MKACKQIVDFGINHHKSSNLGGFRLLMIQNSGKIRNVVLLLLTSASHASIQLKNTVNAYFTNHTLAPIHGLPWGL